MKRLRVAWKVMACALLFTGVAPGPLLGQEPLAPLTRDELIDMFARPIFRDNPQRALNDFIRRNKIAFLPTRSAREYLIRNGVPEEVVKELKHNFASRIVYRVCDFEPDDEARQFSRTLRDEFGATRILMKADPNSLLRDKQFNPLPCGPRGLGAEEVSFHTGYVMLLGDVGAVPQAGHITVTTRLVFKSRTQETMIVTTPFVRTIERSTTSKNALAHEISRWAIEIVEEEVR